MGGDGRGGEGREGRGGEGRGAGQPNQLVLYIMLLLLLCTSRPYRMTL